MGIIEIITLAFLNLLVIAGAVYSVVYEDAPIHERVQVFGVGIAILIGIFLSLLG
jgi:hypothetical protein